MLVVTWQLVRDTGQLLVVASWPWVEVKREKISSEVSVTCSSIDCRDRETKEGGMQAKDNTQAKERSSQEVALHWLEDNLRKFFHQCLRRRYSGSVLVMYHFIRSVKTFWQLGEEAVGWDDWNSSVQGKCLMECRTGSGLHCQATHTLSTEYDKTLTS